MNNNNKINPTPVKAYNAPQIPTLDNVKGDKTFLEKMPLRWKRSAAVLACMGLVGAWTLAGFADNAKAEPFTASVTATIPGTNDALDVLKHMVGLGDFTLERIAELDYNRDGVVNSDDALEVLKCVVGLESVFDEKIQGKIQGLEFKTHYGGSGFANYVVHLTEQEALNIMREHFEKAGLDFSATPPEYLARGATDELKKSAYASHTWGSWDWQYIDEVEDDVAREWWEENAPFVGIDLFDSEKGVAIGQLNNWRLQVDETIKDFERQAAENGENIKFGLFTPLSKSVGNMYSWGWEEPPTGQWEFRGQPTENQMRKAKLYAAPTLKSEAIAQAEMFLAFLRENGIL